MHSPIGTNLGAMWAVALTLSTAGSYSLILLNMMNMNSNETLCKFATMIQIKSWRICIYSHSYLGICLHTRIKLGWCGHRVGGDLERLTCHGLWKGARIIHDFRKHRSYICLHLKGLITSFGLWIWQIGQFTLL